METHQRQFGAKVSKLSLWVIEYIWAHKMADVLEDVDPSSWPEMDLEPLSLEDSWRLRVVSAKVYSIVRNRDVQRFENVLNFLEETYRLLPRLVTPIKHMKIVFGLKTMLIMWMLKRGRGIIDTMFKINQFFPSRLTQYQNQCSQREIFLMKKNHLDFKNLAQSLAMDKGKLERYVENQMQQQYGDHYAQKVEDRLLQYLQKLEAVLPGDAYIDELLKKQSPASEEEKLLLEVISSDSPTIATTLKKLLHCEVTFTDLGKALPEPQAKGPQPSKSPRCSTPPESHLKAVNLQTNPQSRGGEEPADPDVPVDSPVLLEQEKNLEFQPVQRITRDDQRTRSAKEESCDGTDEECNRGSSEEPHGASSSPQFCSKHQRWVKSILQECPEERQSDASVSPPLFQSSSPRPSSQDLTPSDLVPCRADRQRPASDASSRSQTPEKTCEKANATGHMTSGSSSFSGGTSEGQPALQPSSFREAQMPVLSLRLQRIDAASVGGPEPPCRAFPSGSSEGQPALQTSSFREAQMPVLSLRLQRIDAASVGGPEPPCRAFPSGSSEGQPALQPSSFREVQMPVLSLKLQRIDAASVGGPEPPCRAFPNGSSASPRNHSSLSGNRAPTSLRRQSSETRALPQGATSSPLEDVNKAETVPGAGSASTSAVKERLAENTHQPSLSDGHRVSALPTRDASADTRMAPLTEDVPVSSAQHTHASTPLWLSLPSQAVLLRSKLLQPCVSLPRLSPQHCHRATSGRSSTGRSGGDDEGAGVDEEEDREASFDIHHLYSSHSSSSSVGEDSTLWDSDYEPRTKKKRRV